MLYFLCCLGNYILIKQTFSYYCTFCAPNRKAYCMTKGKAPPQVLFLFKAKGLLIVGNTYYIGKSNSFWINNLPDFKNGLKGFVGGEHASPVQFNYEDYKRRSKKALINVSSGDFDTNLHHKDNDEIELDFLEYIQSFIIEGETCTIHLVTYEHAGDMSITKYIVTSNDISEVYILED